MVLSPHRPPGHHVGQQGSVHVDPTPQQVPGELLLERCSERRDLLGLVLLQAAAHYEEQSHLLLRLHRASGNQARIVHSARGSRNELPHVAGNRHLSGCEQRRAVLGKQLVLGGARELRIDRFVEEDDVELGHIARRKARLEELRE